MFKTKQSQIHTRVRASFFVSPTRFSGGDIEGSLSVVLRRRLALSSASQKNSVTFFSGTTQANFLIFGTEHQYGELYRVMQF